MTTMGTITVELRKNPAVAAIMRATFPNYRRKTVWLNPRGAVTLCDLNWSGGTRSEYRACTLGGSCLGGSGKYNAMAPWDNYAEGKTIEIPPGRCMVRAGFFCGKPSHATIYYNGSDNLLLGPDGGAVA